MDYLLASRLRQVNTVNVFLMGSKHLRLNFSIWSPAICETRLEVLGHELASFLPPSREITAPRTYLSGLLKYKKTHTKSMDLKRETYLI